MNILLLFILVFSNLDHVPVLYEGRIRPHSSFTKSYLENEGKESSLEELPLIPTRIDPTIWVTLNALNTEEENFTLFNDEDFIRLKNDYLTLGNLEVLAESLLIAYDHLDKKPLLLTNNLELSFPSLIKLKLETFYVKFPWVTLTLLLFLFSSICVFFSLITKSRLYLKLGIYTASCGFIIHSTLLAFRVIILERPAVASMYETLLFVPLVAVSLSFILYYIYRQPLLLIGGNLIELSLLTLLFLTDSKTHLDPIQPVLNSQLWLSIHVLMVVASYGVFAIGSVIGHTFFFKILFTNSTESSLKQVEKILLQVLYIGVILLTGGTILGGVWAAQSWGRFWDWDPKESWAFISISLYLICIHLYRFHKIGNRGLAFGAISGFLAISFCWYGVNYIIGSGMHSYGFGNGGSIYYLSFLAIELLFLSFALTTIEKSKIVRRKIRKGHKIL